MNTEYSTTENGVQTRPHVVIVGAGFAGLNAAKTLRGAAVDVTLIDRNNYHKFQPLLYEVAMAGLEPDDIAHNVRDVFRRVENIHFRMGTVVDIDTEAQRLRLHDGEVVTYDFLLLATGAVTNYFGVEGAETHAFPLKNVPDAVNLRNHILRQFERYDRDRAAALEGLLTFVLVGGGPTGVEMAGALVELFDTLQDDYPAFDVRKVARVVLVEMQPDLLPPYAEPLRDYTRRTLEKRGVEVRTETVVERVEADAVHFTDGTRLPTQTLVWAAGVQASPVANLLKVEQTRGGQVLVNDDLSVPGLPNVFVAGDMGATRDEAGDVHPQVAQVAIQHGRHAARQIRRRLESKSPEPFHYTDYGQMATIGRNAAVAELAGGVRFKGLLAWLVWVVVHIAKLVGFRNRVSVFMDWIYNYFTYKRHARLILDMVPVSDALPAEREDEDGRLAGHRSPHAVLHDGRGRA